MPNKWMILGWIAILAVVMSVSVLYGAQDCQVPKSGPFHVLMKGQEYVPTGSHSFHFAACRRVK